MPKRIVIIQGHPDPAGGHFGHVLADAYAAAARAAGHVVETLPVAQMDFPLVRTKNEWDTGEPPPSIRAAQEAIRLANHLLIVYPLWLGAMPAVLKAFFEQVFRPGFSTTRTSGPEMWKKQLTGRSARIVVTMGMPALIYRWYFGAYTLKSLERNILKFCGIAPVRSSIIGSVETLTDATRARWLERMRDFGRAAR